MTRESLQSFILKRDRADRNRTKLLAIFVLLFFAPIFTQKLHLVDFSSQQKECYLAVLCLIFIIGIALEIMRNSTKPIPLTCGKCGWDLHGVVTVISIEGRKRRSYKKRIETFASERVTRDVALEDFIHCPKCGEAL